MNKKEILDYCYSRWIKLESFDHNSKEMKAIAQFCRQNKDEDVFVEVVSVEPALINWGVLPFNIKLSKEFRARCFFANPNVCDFLSIEELKEIKGEFDSYYDKPQIKEFLDIHYEKDMKEDYKELLDVVIEERELDLQRQKENAKRKKRIEKYMATFTGEAKTPKPKEERKKWNLLINPNDLNIRIFLFINNLLTRMSIFDKIRA